MYHYITYGIYNENSVVDLWTQSNFAISANTVSHCSTHMVMLVLLTGNLHTLSRDWPYRPAGIPFLALSEAIQTLCTPSYRGILRNIQLNIETVLLSATVSIAVVLKKLWQWPHRWYVVYDVVCEADLQMMPAWRHGGRYSGRKEADSRQFLKQTAQWLLLPWPNEIVCVRKKAIIFSRLPAYLGLFVKKEDPVLNVPCASSFLPPKDY